MIFLVAIERATERTVHNVQNKTKVAVGRVGGFYNLISFENLPYEVE